MINRTTKPPLVDRLVIRAEETYTWVERYHLFPVELIMMKQGEPEVARAPCPRFKEWTHDYCGLEIKSHHSTCTYEHCVLTLQL